MFATLILDLISCKILTRAKNEFDDYRKKTDTSNTPSGMFHPKLVTIWSHQRAIASDVVSGYDAVDILMRP